ncbi:MAG: leucyl aminopeptidase [Lachnospiraceae bacterium]|nr:leucyl aminopeptidase [Lachnospiraceae bacterium]
MKYSELFKTSNEEVSERYELVIERINEYLNNENDTSEYSDYFHKMADFYMLLSKWYEFDEDYFESLDVDELAKWNDKLYEDVKPDNYKTSFANPVYATKVFGSEYGPLLCFLYTELRSGIVYATEKRLKELTLYGELFVQVLCMFEDEVPTVNELKETLYYFVSDYVTDFVDYRVAEILDPKLSFATDIVMESDLSDIRYLYRYGEYISDNEIELARFLGDMSDEAIESMAYTYTHGYEEGFKVAGIDLTKKKSVNIRYSVGQERIVKAAVNQFEKMGLKPVIYRAAIERVNRKLTIRSGYCSTSVNKQYDYDHRMDDALFIDKAFVERKIDATRNAYESRKQLAKEYAGPAVIEVFGEKPFEPVNNDENMRLSEKQQKLSVYMTSELSKLINIYIPQSEYSFTIIAYPLPEIGDNFKEIFDAVVKINTLDNEAYKKVQQIIIDELDKAVSVKVVGCGDNCTDMTVMMHDLENPLKETNFENCTADVNIPVGEVFTSPKLTGTCGVLNVSEVYLNELKYKNLKITFKDGKIAEYTCDNFETEEENRAYIKENVMFNRETLPIGEFAIGTNTTAYVLANEFDIVYKLPILIAEKMGPHFAVGDTCYSRSEEIRLYNPDGKEIVAKDNECSLLRDTDEDNAYFNCHTDITIPYDELKAITSVHADGTEVDIIRNGRFVLEGCDMLNEPFKKA